MNTIAQLFAEPVPVPADHKPKSTESWLKTRDILRKAYNRRARSAGVPLASEDTVQNLCLAWLIRDKSDNDYAFRIWQAVGDTLKTAHDASDAKQSEAAAIEIHDVLIRNNVTVSAHSRHRLNNEATILTYIHTSETCRRQRSERLTRLTHAGRAAGVDVYSPDVVNRCNIAADSAVDTDILESAWAV